MQSTLTGHRWTSACVKLCIVQHGSVLPTHTVAQKKRNNSERGPSAPCAFSAHNDKMWFVTLIIKVLMAFELKAAKLVLDLSHLPWLLLPSSGYNKQPVFSRERHTVVMYKDNIPKMPHLVGKKKKSRPPHYFSCQTLKLFTALHTHFRALSKITQCAVGSRRKR